jgi:cyclomaltodextrinase
VQDNNPEYNNDKPDTAAYQRARLAALLQMTYIGAPLIYYGDEAGMWGADDPSNRKPMLWEDLEPYANPDINHVMDEHLAYYREIIALRNEHAALRTGGFESLLADSAADAWAFLRFDGSEQLLVALNASEAERVVHVPLPAGSPADWTHVFGGDGTVSAQGDRLTLTIPPLSGAVLQAAR